MKREIKFRAKRLHQKPGVWVYGYYHRHAHASALHYINGYEVDHTTVCQYIGIKDRNNREIFEDDIIEYRPTNSGSALRYVVTYTNRASFVMARDNSNAILTFEESALFGEIEVIGNIHDNPVLMKGGER